jgi:hypothetical protein
MDIQAFFKAVKAEFVGGRVKAVVEGVHHWIAHYVDGNVVLTAVGHEILASLSAKAPHLVAQLENVPGAIGEIQGIVANPAAAFADVAGASAVDAAFAELEKAVPTKKVKAKPAVAPTVGE